MSAPAAADALAKIIALLPEAALAVSGDGVIRSGNDRASEMLGVRTAQLSGRSLPEFTEEPRRVAEYLRLCARSNKPVPGGLNLIASTGARTPCRCEGALLNLRSEAAPALLLLRLIPKATAVNRFITLNLRIEELGREITRRQRAEATLRDQRELLKITLSSIGDAVIATDAAGRITFMNPIAERYTGWTQTEASGRHLDEVFVIVNEATRTSVESPVSKVLREGVVVGLANHTVLISRDRSTRPIDDSGAPIRDANGQVLGVVMVFRDISDRRSLERERAEGDRRKDEFLAMLAHELRNPLAVLANGMEVIRAARAGGNAIEGDLAIGKVSEAMQRQVGQLARLVDELLDVSRITTGKIVMRPAPARLETVLQQAVEAARPAMSAGGIELTVVHAAEPLPVEADVQRLSQVFDNLLSNAAKFTERGGRIVLAGAKQGEQAVVSVRDTGAGIAPDMLRTIFELFVQADSSLARSQGGLGLGLTIAKLIAELHGGSIEARSEGVGRGSEFIVRLPLAKTPGDVQSGKDAARAPHSPARRILVVDDNVDAAASLATVLRLSRQDVRVAHDGEEALRLAAAFSPQVVLLDIGLPGMDGYEVARRLRRQPGMEKALLIAVSGYGRDSDRRQAREAGLDHHLTKPISLDSLKALMSEHR